MERAGSEQVETVRRDLSFRKLCAQKWGREIRQSLKRKRNREFAFFSFSLKMRNITSCLQADRNNSAAARYCGGCIFKFSFVCFYAFSEILSKVIS